MEKIKGQGRITKFLATKIGSFHRNNFDKFIYGKNNLAKLVESIKKDIVVPFDVISFSSSRDFSEQLLSILTFIRQVGVPNAWVIYSDGSHKKEQVELCKIAMSFVKIEIIEFTPEYVAGSIKKNIEICKKDFISFSEKAPYGKKLFFYLNIIIERPTIFVDSDVLFYKKASGLLDLLRENVDGWFLPDVVWGTLDNHYKKNQHPQPYQVNSGFFLCKKDFNSTRAGLEYFRSMEDNFEHFTEQNIFHIILLDNNYMPLDPRIFVLDLEDQFDFSYIMPFDKMALRHYTTPVRHKMWQAGWRKQLGIK